VVEIYCGLSNGAGEKHEEKTTKNTKG